MRQGLRPGRIFFIAGAAINEAHAMKFLDLAKVYIRSGAGGGGAVSAAAMERCRRRDIGGA